MAPGARPDTAAANDAPRGRLRGRRVLVTGASRGIGRTIAEVLAKAGADVVLHARERGHLDEAANALGASGARVACAFGDLATEQGARQTGDMARAAFGGIDILVNNAGTAARGLLLDAGPARLSEVFAVNVTACMIIAQCVAPQMIEQGWGRIINIGSPYARRPASGLSAYCMTKAALEMLTKCMALEWAGTGITANAVAPIQVLTDLTRPSYDDPERRRLIDMQIPIGRWARADDLTGAIMLLASDDSSMMTGQTLYVDGGRLLI